MQVLISTALLTQLLVMVTLLLCGFIGWRLMRRPRTESPLQRESLAEQIELALPQTQCGQCGFAGCAPYAEALTHGEAINKCPPGGQQTIRLLATLLNQPIVELDPAHGVHQPPRVASIREPECIGCTKCIQACPVDAILGAPKLMHTVIASECTGCDLCVEPCPVDCIDMVPASGKSASAELMSHILSPRVEPERLQLPGKVVRILDRQQRRLSEYRRERYESRKKRLARDAQMRRGSRRRSVARPENPDVSDNALQNFSREQARLEIADAVARVRQRKQGRKTATKTTDDNHPSG